MMLMGLVFLFLLAVIPEIGCGSCGGDDVGGEAGCDNNIWYYMTLYYVNRASCTDRLLCILGRRRSRRRR